jgi:putative hydrolase of the HAD superfamily
MIVFDLDDTLYLERDFVRSGFQAAGAWLKRIRGSDGLEQHCLDLFGAGQRTRIFDTALDRLGIGGDKDLVARLVEIYRTHSPNISLAPDAHRYLRRRAVNQRFALVTDGLAATQKAKVRALDLDQKLDYFVYTDCWGRDFWKPHQRAFEALEVWSGNSAAELVYVADNPAKDFVTPRARGWRTVQIIRPERIHFVTTTDAAYDAHAAVASLDELDSCLASIIQD